MRRRPTGDPCQKVDSLLAKGFALTLTHTNAVPAQFLVLEHPRLGSRVIVGSDYLEMIRQA